jgi:hypothetical protein
MSGAFTIVGPRLEAASALAQAVHWLAAAAARCVLAVALGALLARALRVRQLHWSWAFAPAGLALELRGPLHGLAALALLASVWAARSGRRHHLDDLDAGLDLRERAEARRTAADRLAGMLTELTARLRTGFALRDAGDGVLRLGRDERGRTVSVSFGAGSHTLVVGATGSGKTVTQTAIAVHEIACGSAAVIVDPKGDPAMRDAVRMATAAAGRRFVRWTPAGDFVYNPYARGSESEIADKVLAGELFTEPHYLRQAQRYVGHVVRALRASGGEVCLAAIVAHLDPMRLELLVRDLPPACAQATHTYLDALTPRQRADLSGVRDRLAILAESDVGPWLDPATDGVPRFELLQAVRAGATVYFDLESDRRPLLAQMLGGAIVQDLLTAVAALQAQPLPALIVIDEFSAVAARHVVRLFGRARSAGFTLLLGTQELSDLRPPGNERLLEQVVGNLSLLLAHRQVVPASAELIAGIAGARGAWRVTRHSDGRSSRIRTCEKALSPGRVMALRPGWAAVVGLADARQARITRIQRPQCAAAEAVR